MTPLDLRPIPAEGDGRPTVSQDSPLDQIRSVYREAKGAPRLSLPVPGHKYLRVRYKPLDDDYEPKENVTAADIAIDMLIACCDQFEVRLEDGQWVALTEDGRALGFSDLEIIDALGLDVASPEHGGTVRDMVLAVYSWAPKPKVAVMDTFERLTRWMSGAREVDEERLLGES